MSKKIYILSEHQIQRVVDEILKEQTEKIYTDFDGDWDYKFVNNEWFATRKGKNNWVSLKNYPVAVKRLNAKYNPTTTQLQTPISPINTQSRQPGVPFKNVTEGNRFRQWFIKTYPDKAKEIDLDPTGSFNNSYISRAFNTKTTNGQTAGQIYSSIDKGSLYTHTNPSYQDRIDLDKLSSTDTVNVCNISDDTTDCAQFVNNFSDKIKVVGNAWEAFENGEVGKSIFSVFRNLTDEQVKKYFSIYRYVNGGGQDANGIKAFEEELINQAGQPPKLAKGDIVGIYYPPSTHHIEAFKGSATYRNWYPDGKPGKTLRRKKIGHTFNTHVGVVGAIKDGVPLIFHNIKGILKSDPAQNLKIVWVKRP